MVEYYDTSEKILFSIFCLMVTTVLGFAIYAIIKYKLKHPIYKFLFVVSIIGIIFNILWITSVFFPSENLGGVVILFAWILLPFLWFFAALGIIIYGTAAILTRKTYVKYLPVLLPKKAEGVEAIYLGILWVIAGLMMILMELMAIGFILCENIPWFCPLVDGVDHIFGSLGNILIFLSKPLEWMGLARPR